MTQEDLALFHKITDALLTSEAEHPVAPYYSYDEIYNQVDLQLNDAPLSDEEYVKSMSGLVELTPKTCTPEFFNQLFGGRHGKAVIGEMLAALMNNSMYTYKVGGPMIAMEKTILNHLKQRIGYDNQAEGTIASGGSMTNFMALLMARDTCVPTATTKGVRQALIAYTSEESHYSLTKNVSFAGTGKDNIRFIKANDRGEMITKELILQIEKDRADGHTPFFVNATSGTTVLGAFDPLRAIGEYCNKEGIWFHVDGAYGGAVMFSERYRHLIDGSELADSFSFNAHKMMSVPITCSFILTKHKKALYDSFNYDASYLYQTDVDEINPGKISLQCGRRNDALKFWSLWKAIGTSGLEAMVDHQFHLAQVARDYISKNSNYTLYSHSPSVNVCFNYKGIPADQLCNGLYAASSLMVGYGSHQGVRFVRFVTTNAGNQEADIYNFFKELEAYADTNF